MENQIEYKNPSIASAKGKTVATIEKHFVNYQGKKQSLIYKAEYRNCKWFFYSKYPEQKSFGKPSTEQTSILNFVSFVQSELNKIN